MTVTAAMFISHTVDRHGYEHLSVVHGFGSSMYDVADLPEFLLISSQYFLFFWPVTSFNIFQYPSHHQSSAERRQLTLTVPEIPPAAGVDKVLWMR